MTNDVFCIGLTRTELQTLRVLLPTTFPILTTEPDALDEAMIEHIAEQARCMVLNPKRLTATQLEEFLYAQRRLNGMTEAMPFLRNTILLSYDTRSLAPGIFLGEKFPALCNATGPPFPQETLGIRFPARHDTTGASFQQETMGKEFPALLKCRCFTADLTKTTEHLDFFENVECNNIRGVKIRL